MSLTPPGYADITKVGQAYVKAAPERMVWGSNWPHPNETNKPDDAALFDLMPSWAPDEKTRNRILVENSAAAVRVSEDAVRRTSRTMPCYCQRNAFIGSIYRRPTR